MKSAPQDALPEIQLNSGGLIVAEEPQWVVTVLGSCVAVTMFHSRSGLAAICHALLPQPRSDAPAHISRTERGRYVTLVVPAMVHQFIERRIKPADIEVKLFGGANILQVGGKGQHLQGVGSANVVAARQSLAGFQLKIIAENVGGLRGRKILFNTQTGEVLHKHLAHMHERLR
jgi:chemotaxis protein CheD